MPNLRPKIKNWTDIAVKYNKGTLILGNGASISVNTNFIYDSLKEEAIERGELSRESALVFEKLKSSDFEYVLRNIDNVKELCNALELHIPKDELGKLDEYYQQIRSALVETVRNIHPKPNDARVIESLPRMSDFMKSFDTVVSLSYDLLVYWAIMRAKERDNTHEFKDCFNKQMEFVVDFEWMRKPNRKKKATSVTLVFYPHGSLVLSKGINGTERKIKIEKQKGEKLVARQNRLLDTILDKWKNTKEIPIFVCEGKTEAKEFSINNSTYLNTVYCNVLKNLEENIVIYGWKIGEEDKHLLKAIEISKPKRIAISLFSAKITKNERDIEMSATLSSIENLITKMKGFKYNNTKLEFFYATSPDCWVY